MFGLEFLFGWGLLALPLAGLPVLLHLLFRRKSPIVPFSTLRFIKSSLQHTAARKKVQRWLLLAVRCLLLLLLIWAIAQPAKMMASGWFGAGGNTAAAIVVDTSHSMQVSEGGVSLLDRANEVVENLLRGQLKDAKVAVFQTRPAPPDRPEQLTGVSKVLSEWVRLAPQAHQAPLGDRAASAIELLRRQEAESKWLVIITDLQSREFPRPLPEFSDGRIVLLDLHPHEARNAGATRIAPEPEQPIPGIGAQAVVEVTGRANENRAVTLDLSKTDGTSLWQSP
ncbi:MAG: BatA domain-containing protein, partial [Tepidisphaeraceae bacterium]